MNPSREFLVQNAQKYRPQTYIFDIGGSYELVTRIFDGTYLNVGRESRDFAINPFSLARTPDNLQFLFSFFRVLIEGRDQRYRMDFREEQKLWSAIERIYEPTSRRLIAWEVMLDRCRGDFSGERFKRNKGEDAW